MSREYKPILICNGNEKHLREDGELTCGGCGYIFDSRSTLHFFNNIEINADCRGCRIHVSSTPLYCENCGQEFEKIHFSELGETLFIVPLSMFKKRYVTKYGELILLKEGDYAEFIPSWDPEKRRPMVYIDAVAYMLYATGIKYQDFRVLLSIDDFAFYNDGTIIGGELMEDIHKLAPRDFNICARLFTDIALVIREMEKDEFFTMGVD